MNGTRHLHRCALKRARTDEACCTGDCRQGRDCSRRASRDQGETLGEVLGLLFAMVLVLATLGLVH